MIPMERNVVDVLTSLRQYIKENFLSARGIESIEDDGPLLEPGIVDSMGILQLVSFLETEFGIAVDDADIVPRNFATTASVATFVESKRGAAGT